MVEIHQLAACAVLSFAFAAGVSAQQTSTQPPTVHDDGSVSCLLTVSVLSRLATAPVSLGKAPHEITALHLRVHVEAMKPYGQTPKDKCQIDAPFDDPDLVVYFLPAQAKTFTAPARVEIVSTSLAMGNALYGVPNPLFFSLLRILPPR